MEELTLRQMQEGALNILKKLDGICREQGLRYFLFYGTLIGAIRHKGFIPWDDDLDVAMPRPDFDRLVEYCRRHREELLPMRLMTVDDNPRYVYPIARFSDTRYRVKYQGIRDYGLGLFVDIYPLDGCGDTEEEARAWVQQPMRDVKFINCCAADRFTPSRRGWLHTPAKLAGFAWARLHGSAHYIHRIEAWARQKDYEKCRYVGCTVWDTKWNIVFLREDLEKTLYVPFEDAEFPIPAGYDRMLRHTYGDYMTPPPPEHRIGQHFYTVWPKEQGAAEEHKEGAIS